LILAKGSGRARNQERQRADYTFDVDLPRELGHYGHEHDT
jgi:hypothetical protein